MREITPMQAVTIALCLAIALAAAIWAFVVLSRRETRHRRRLAEEEWAGRRGWKWMEDDSSAAMEFLAALNNLSPRIRRMVRGDGTAVAQIETRPDPITGANAPHWNVLVRKSSGNWAATGLRPTSQKVSIIDLFPLGSFPSLATTDRFMIFGTEGAAAAALANSSAGALLPPDVGLMVLGDSLVMDFTNRPFDTIEFDRMIDLAEQMAARLARPAG